MTDIDLGKKYNEEFRQFLLGSAGFPADAAVIVDVFGPQCSTLASMAFPYGGNKDGYHVFRFSIPVVAFNLFVGKLLPPETRSCCTLRSTDQIVLSSKKDSQIVEGFIKLMSTAKESRNLYRLR